MEIIVLVGIWIWLGCAFYAAHVAYAKGYGYGLAWAFGGFFFGFIALIAAAGMPDRMRRDEIQKADAKTEAPEVEPDRRGLFGGEHA